VDRIVLDLNNPVVQETWFALETAEALRVLASLRKFRRMSWSDLYRDGGLRWEAILSRNGPGGQRIYSLRVTQKVHAVAFRQGDYLRFLTLHADHDSAYE